MALSESWISHGEESSLKANMSLEDSEFIRYKARS